MTRKFFCILMLCFCLLHNRIAAQDTVQLKRAQQAFIDMGFGMFIHYGMPTFFEADWPPPDAPLTAFNSPKLNPDQWAKAAKSANMAYGCLTTKHHSGFAIWNTKTTSYNVMNTPLGRDVVKEYAEAFRKNGIKVGLYYSILDIHHGIRPNQVVPAHLTMIKEQLTELLTNYGEISILIFDGWDAPWSRISYDDISFQDIYLLIKKLQPNCLVVDHNAAKYPAEALFYSDIATYEQNAGQFVSTATNQLPALASYPLQKSWFWKKSFPTTPTKSPGEIVNKFVIPYNKAHCNMVLNVAPNTDGLIDENALEALKEIGRLYKKQPSVPLPEYDAPIIASNIAKHETINSSWSYDMEIMDFGNDDNFHTYWVSEPSVKNPWLEVQFKKEMPFNAVVITERKAHITDYKLEVYSLGEWKVIARVSKPKPGSRVHIHRFNEMRGEKLRISIAGFDEFPAIAELGVYFEPGR